MGIDRHRTAGAGRLLTPRTSCPQRSARALTISSASKASRTSFCMTGSATNGLQLRFGH